MLTYLEALERVLARVPGPQTGSVELSRAPGHVLAQAVCADVDVPPFDKSFMDGFAVRSRDTAAAPVDLRVVGTSPAGKMIDAVLRKGEAIRIMTGAPLPAGADAVQMIEKTAPLEGDRIRILESVEAGQHVAPRASEVPKGAVVLTAGRLVTPAEIGVLGTFGRARVEVYRKPSVRIITTGDELVSVETQPAPGQIRNSNACMLAAQCRALGLNVLESPPVADDPEAIREAIRSNPEIDLTIFSGGVSMGEFDFVHRVLREEGIEIFFHKAAVKPGKPLIVGASGSRLFFGLPGNPVSSFVTFEIFARPAIEKWMGLRDHRPFLLAAELGEEITQKPGRLFFQPARTSSTPIGFQTRPVPTRGSADITAFSRANSLILVPAEVSRLEAGATVEVLPLSPLSAIPCLGFENRS